jgi:hypothetical protein
MMEGESSSSRAISAPPDQEGDPLLPCCSRRELASSYPFALVRQLMGSFGPPQFDRMQRLASVVATGFERSLASQIDKDRVMTRVRPFPLMAPLIPRRNAHLRVYMIK